MNSRFSTLRYLITYDYGIRQEDIVVTAIDPSRKIPIPMVMRGVTEYLWSTSDYGRAQKLDELRRIHLN